MIKNKLIIDLIQWVIIITLSGMCMLLYSNNTLIIEKYKNKTQHINNINIEKSSVVIKYILTHNKDTIYVNRKLPPLIKTTYNN